MKRLLVKDFMTRKVLTIAPNMTLPDAHIMMMHNKVRRLPVVKNDRVVGIVTRGDVREASPSDATSLSIWEMNYLISKIKVKDIMTPDPVTISPEATFGEAAKLMLDKKISALPVVEGDGKLVGIITESDIFRIIAKEWCKEE